MAEVIEAQDPNVIPVPSRPVKGGMIGKLRPGFLVQTGADNNDPDSFIHGPADVPLTPALAIAHMAKWENVNDVKIWLRDNFPALVVGKPHLAPRTHRRLTPAQQLDRSIDQVNRINDARLGNGPARPAAAGTGLTADDVAAIAAQAAAQAVSAATAPIVKAVNQLSSALGLETLAAPQSTPATPPPSRNTPAARTRRRGQ